MSSSPSCFLHLNDLQVSYPEEQGRPEFPHEEPPPLTGDLHHHNQVLLRHEGEDDPGQVPGEDPPLQPGENVQLLASVSVTQQSLHLVISTEPTY